MSLGTNIQYLRKLNRLTQEQFAEKMNISRQTVSRWEADEVTPELDKLVELCSMFSCKLDELVRENMSFKEEIYSKVEIRKVPSFKMARYVMISPNPEDDVQSYMRKWGEKSGLFAFDSKAKMIGWDFPFVSQEQQTRFGLHGYVAAYVIPKDLKQIILVWNLLKILKRNMRLLLLQNLLFNLLKEFQLATSTLWSFCRRTILKINNVMIFLVVLNMNMKKMVFVIWIFMFMHQVLQKPMHILLLSKD